MKPLALAQFPEEAATDGAWKRQPSRFHRHVRAAPDAEFLAATGRYHLYVSYACPWAHRTIIVRHLKGLDGVISMSAVDPIRDHRGWAFTGDEGTDLDSLNGFRFLAQAYQASDPAFAGRVTVPVLWDKQAGEIVNNESSEIIRMLNGEFDEWAAEPGPALDLYPAELRDEIDQVNDFVYPHINDGVYRCGFAATQRAYDEAFEALFAGLDEVELRLSSQRYLVGDRITEADWRLFTTLVRFDSVYVGHFKCNRRRIVDYPNLWGYLRELYQVPGVANTVHMDQIKRHYYVTHTSINPSQIVPHGSELHFDEPHRRDQLGG